MIQIRRVRKHEGECNTCPGIVPAAWVIIMLRPQPGVIGASGFSVRLCTSCLELLGWNVGRKLRRVRIEPTKAIKRVKPRAAARASLSAKPTVKARASGIARPTPKARPR